MENLRKSKYKKISDVYINFEELGGVFGSVSYPWGSTIDNRDLNAMYFSESGEFLAGSYVLNFLKDKQSLDADARVTISNIIAYRYLKKWSKLWDTLNFEYNPIENYRMIEDERDESTSTSTMRNSGDSSDTINNLRTLNTNDETTQTNSGTDTHTQTFDTNDKTSNNTTQTISDLQTKNLTDSQNSSILKNGSETETDNKSVYAFNSNEARPTDIDNLSKNFDDKQTITETNLHTGTDSHESTTTNGGTVDLKKTGTVTSEDKLNTSFNTSTSNTGTISDSNTLNHNFSDSQSGSDESRANRNLTRSGNIGVTTSQELIEAERELWLWDYFKEVFSDINKLITLPIF